MRNHAYALDHDGRVPFAPFPRLSEQRADVAEYAVIALGHRYPPRDEDLREAVELAGLWDDLLTAGIYRSKAAREARAARPKP